MAAAPEMTWLKMLIMRQQQQQQQQQQNNRPPAANSHDELAATDKDERSVANKNNNHLQIVETTKQDEKVRSPMRVAMLGPVQLAPTATSNRRRSDQSGSEDGHDEKRRLPQLVWREQQEQQQVTSHTRKRHAAREKENQQVELPGPNRMEFLRRRRRRSSSSGKDEYDRNLNSRSTQESTKIKQTIYHQQQAAHKHTKTTARIQKMNHCHMPTRVALATLALCTLSVSLIAQQLLGPNATLGGLVTTAAAAAASSSGRQSFASQPEPRYLIAAGQQVRLPCFVSHRQGKCAWLGPGQQIITSGKRYVFAELPSDGDCSLVIKRADVTNDDGMWQCQALADDEKLDTAPLIRSRPSQLVVLMPPERPRINDLSKGNNKLILEESQERNVTCEIRGGNPAPLIEWHLDGKLIVQNVETLSPTSAAGEPRDRLVQSRLLLTNIKRALNGKNLTCVGVHQTANQSTSIELDVHYLPVVSVPQTEVTLIEGSPLSVICQVDANPAATHVFWKLVNSDANEKASSLGAGLFAQLSGASSSANNREALMTSTQGPLLEMAKITRTYNRNSYQCLAQNSVGVSQPVDVRLNILYPPQSINTTENTHVQVGTNHQLVCAFDGNPQPEVKWHYMDPLARTPAMLAVDNTRDQQLAAAAAAVVGGDDKLQSAKTKALFMQQFLNIKNVTFRNEGDYVCEARNTINGHTNLVRSAVMSLDVYGEPQFLVKTPVQAKAVQGSKSDISLTFCSDPAPTKVYWQFGSNQVIVSLPNANNQEPRVVLPSRGASGHQTNSRAHHQHAHALHAQQRFQAQPLQPLQRRDSQFSRLPTCFEATLTLLDPEMNDSRDYSLFVQNELGFTSNFVHLRVASPLSPALMITSAFVFIFGLFLCALLFLFALKKRQQFLGGRRAGSASAAGSTEIGGGQPTANGNSSSKRRSRRDKNLLAGANGVAGELTNGLHKQVANGTADGANGSAARQQQTNGVVNGLGNGLANGASNPTATAAGLQQLAVVDDQHHHAKGMMSMASSDTSCNDQKQLLASSSSSDRNSSGGSSNGGVTVSSGTGDYHHHHLHHQHSNTSDDRSTANSTPSPMNHISVDDELHLNGTYQATESITSGAPLAHNLNGASALIYANIDYARKQQRPSASDDQDHNQYHGHSPPDSMTLNNDPRSAAHKQVSPDGSEASTVQESGLGRHGSSTRRGQQQQQQLSDEHQAPSSGGVSTTTNRPSVGATIAMMNSLAAAQAAAMNSPTGLAAGAPQTGVLNGAINQQLMANSANRQVRKPGPPKPPKPSIQQRSRFYQQQAAAAAAANAANGGLVMIGNSQMGQQYPPGQVTAAPTGTNIEHQDVDHMATTATTLPNHDLAAEYSRLAFPARAEL